MSAPQGSGDPSENEADVDLKGVIKDLHDEIKALNKLLLTFGQSVQGVNKGFHMTMDDRLKLRKIDDQRIKENIKLRASLRDSTSAMDKFSSALQGGFSPMQMFLGVASKMGGMTTELDDFKKKSSEFAEIQKDLGVTDPKSKEFANLSDKDKKKYMSKSAEVDEAKTKKEGSFGGQGGASGKLVEGLSKMKAFAEKHATGLIIGAGSVGILLMVLKKAFSASPMFQQMMKLLNFGIMMVLRPIGDFFGFLFRPILIMLLRKFIIPWYTKMYPAMIKMGDLIGNKLSGAFEALATGDVVGAFAILFAGVDFKKILGDAFAGIRTWIAETDWDQVWDDLVAGLLAFGTGIWDYIIKPIGEAIHAELIKINWKAAIWDTIKLLVPVMAAADFIAGMFGIGNNKWANEWGRAVGDWFRKGLDEAKANWSMMWYNVYFWFAEGVTKIGGNWSNFFTGIYDWFKNGLTTAVSNWGNLGQMIKDALWNAVMGGGNNNSNNNNNSSWSLWAGGGHITEPMAAIGLRSGKKVMMGEAGNETVIPDSQLGAGGITINIQNMSGSQQDLNNLRQVILDVVQESSARRGRA